MRRFTFRLESVLDFRRMEEDSAKQSYLEIRSQRVAIEAEIETYPARRMDLLLEPVLSVDDHRELEARLAVLDAHQRAHEIQRGVLLEEEEKAFEFWTLRRQAVMALEKLKENALVEWTLEAEREEQAALDEWASQRRVG